MTCCWTSISHVHGSPLGRVEVGRVNDVNEFYLNGSRMINHFSQWGRINPEKHWQVHDSNPLMSHHDDVIKWKHFFRVTGLLCREFTGHRWIPPHAQRPVTRGLDAFFDIRINKRLSKQSWGWWSEKPSRSLWRQCNDSFRKTKYNRIW